jgi:hypothetical protein
MSNGSGPTGASTPPPGGGSGTGSTGGGTPPSGSVSGTSAGGGSAPAGGAGPGAGGAGGGGAPAGGAGAGAGSAQPVQNMPQSPTGANSGPNGSNGNAGVAQTVAPGSNCGPSGATVNITWDAANQTQSSASGPCKCTLQRFVVTYTACLDNCIWRMRVEKISGNVDISINTGGSRNPDTSPPTSEAEAVDAVTVMKAYYTSGRGSWHTAAASIAHENHHYREWKCSAEYYWPQAQADIELLTLPLAQAGSPADAAAHMKNSADSKVAHFTRQAINYMRTLGDRPGDPPYAAGQLVLNASILAVQALAAAKGWKTVPTGIDTPNCEPPCHKPH